jgi:hypothetical protein
MLEVNEPIESHGTLSHASIFPRCVLFLPSSRHGSLVVSLPSPHHLLMPNSERAYVALIFRATKKQSSCCLAGPGVDLTYA